MTSRYVERGTWQSPRASFVGFTPGHKQSRAVPQPFPKHTACVPGSQPTCTWGMPISGSQQLPNWTSYRIICGPDQDKDPCPCHAQKGPKYCWEENARLTSGQGGQALKAGFSPNCVFRVTHRAWSSLLRATPSPGILHSQWLLQRTFSISKTDPK